MNDELIESIYKQYKKNCDKKQTCYICDYRKYKDCGIAFAVDKTIEFMRKAGKLE